MPLILQLGRTAAATMDVAAVLSSVCVMVPRLVGVAGAAIVMADPPALTASDARAIWLAELQQNSEMGPLPGVLRTGRPMLTADLTRIGPPALAAAAAECGLVSSLALLIDHEGERVGALQLLGEARRPVEAADGDAMRPLLDVLAARLVDVRALSVSFQARPKPSAAPQMPSPRRPQEVGDVANPHEVTTRPLPAVTPTAASSSTTPRSFVPRPAGPHAP
jgi:hypothetical protein